MKSTAIILLLVIALGLSESVSANVTAGMTINTSSNMLLRPEGESGVMSSFYAGADKTAGKSTFSLDSGFGYLEHYEGIQFHHHEFEASYILREQGEFAWNIALDAAIVRFGEVSILDGYQQYGLSSNMRTYVTDTILLRWKGDLTRRQYVSFDRENFFEASAVYRIDKFFASGVTVRGQFDAGWRKYDRQEKRPETALIGFSGRTALSLKPWWGVMAEGFIRQISAVSPQDSSQVFDRVFLDDRYKYSSSGVMAGSTWLVKGANSLQLRLYYSKRSYSDAQTAAFSYLPPHGWDEYERSAFLTFSFRPPRLPARLHPVLELFYTDVNASFDTFSYDGKGVTFRLEWR